MTVEPAKIEVPTMIPCPEGDIFNIPTKADLVNAFSQIGQIPSKLEAKLLEFRTTSEREIGELYQQLRTGEGLTDEQRQGILSTIATLESLTEGYNTARSGGQPKTVGGWAPHVYAGSTVVMDELLYRSRGRITSSLRNGDIISFAHYLGNVPEGDVGLRGRYDIWNNMPGIPQGPQYFRIWVSVEPGGPPIERAGYKYEGRSKQPNPATWTWSQHRDDLGKIGVWHLGFFERIVYVNFEIEGGWWDTNFYRLPDAYAGGREIPEGQDGIPFDYYVFWFRSYWVDNVEYDENGIGYRVEPNVPTLPDEWMKVIEEGAERRENAGGGGVITAANQIPPDPGEESIKNETADKVSTILTTILLIDETIKTVRDLMETIEDALEPWWNKDQNRNWQKECNDAITKMMAEFHLYVPIKIAEFVKKFVSINFTITFFGVTIDMLELVTSPDYKKYLKDQIAGAEIVKQIISVKEDIEKVDEELNKLKEDPQSLSAEAEAKLLEEKENLEKKVDDLTLSRQEFVDKVYQLLPHHCRAFDGELGLEDVDAKVEQAVQCIELEIKDWMLNWHVKAFAKLIDLFDEIWDLLGLPDLPFSEVMDVLNLDINELIDKAVQYIKDEFDKTKLGIKKKIDAIDKQLEENPDMDIAAKEELLLERKKLEDELFKEMNEFRQRIRDAILELSIFGMSVREIIGDEIDTTVKSIEQEIAEFKLALQDFKVNWASKLFWAWVKVIKKFLDKIGLGKLFKFLNLTFCDFLKQVGLPLGISLNLPDLGEIDGNPIADVVSTKPKVTVRGTSIDESLDETSFEADGSRVDFPTDGSGSNAYVFIDGVRQNPNTYTDNEDGTITFNSAPTNGIVSVFLSDKSLPAL